MAKGKKTGGKNFPPGVSGNPGGRPPLPDDVRIARDAARGEYDRIVARLISVPADQLEALAKNKKTPALERAVAKTLYVAGRSGDPRRLEAIVNRFARKPMPETEPESQRAPASFVELVAEAEKADGDGDE
jgi:hypothetical protein